MNSHIPKCHSKILKPCPVNGKHSLLLLFLLFPLVRTSKASSAEYWIKDRTSAESTGFTAFPVPPVPSRLPVELPGPSASELYTLPAVNPDREYLQLRICGTFLQPGLVNIQSWAVKMFFVVSYRKP